MTHGIARVFKTSVATAAILALIYCLDSRDEAANSSARAGGSQ